MYGPALTAGPAALVRDSASEHVHPSLGAEHSLLIGRKDQGFCSGHKVRLGRDVTLAIEEEHPQQLAGGIEQMHRDDADRAVPHSSWANGLEREGQEGGGHGCAGERHRRLAPVPSVLRKGRAATRVQPLRGAGAGAGRVT
jgi:hypothetical protein